MKRKKNKTAKPRKDKIYPAKKNKIINHFATWWLFYVIMAVPFILIGDIAYCKYQAEHNGIIVRARILYEFNYNRRGNHGEGYQYEYYYNGKTYEDDSPKSDFKGKFKVGDSFNLHIYPPRPDRSFVLNP